MAATKGQGTLLQLSIASSYTTVAQRVDIDMPEFTRAAIETTDLDATWESFVAGIMRSGELSFTANYDPANSTHAQLWTSVGSGTVESWKLILADAGAAEFAFSGLITKFKPGTAETDGLVRLQVCIKLSGTVTLTP